MGKREMVEFKNRTHKVDIKPVDVTDEDFGETTGKCALALLEFWATWCEACRRLDPTIDALAKDYAGRVFVGKLRADENPRTAKRFKVFKIPTLLVMKKGEEVERIVGYLPFLTDRTIRAKLKKHLNS
jgi:thioredoxin 1